MSILKNCIKINQVEAVVFSYKMSVIYKSYVSLSIISTTKISAFNFILDFVLHLKTEF